MTEQKTQHLLRELISAFVEYPEALEVDVLHYEGEVVFEVRPHKTDESALLGARGCHVRSLQFLTMKIGEANDKRYLFNLLTTDGNNRVRYPDRKSVFYDPEPARLLLLEIMKALGLPVFVSVERDEDETEKLFFIFNIVTTDPKTNRFLLDKQQFGKGEIHLIEAIGKLFWAIAKKEGVGFHLEVEKI